MRRLELPILVLIVAAYLIIAGLYATKTPAWQVPDEPAHYNYIAQVVRNGCCPVLQPGDWDNDYIEAIKREAFKPSALDRLSSVQYEDHQPPLFYLLSAPVYALTGGSLIALRLFSVLIGAGIVIAAYFIVKMIFPAHGYLALATAAFVAFVPQHLAMMGGVDNDSLTELIVALTLLACVWFSSPPNPLSASREGESENARSPFSLSRKEESKNARSPLAVYGEGPGVRLILGILVGLAFITKATAYSLVIIVGVTVMLRAIRERWTPRHFLSVAVWIAIPALIIGGAWWLRNFSVYGFPDFLGLRRHDQVVVGQGRTADYIAQKGLGFVLSDGLQTTFRSFWGQFGWMGVVMPANIVAALIVFTGIVISGAGIAFVRFRNRLSIAQRDSLIILGLAALFAFILFGYYNLSFVQFQGRYLFTGLIPIGLFFAVGLSGWASLIPARAARWVVLLVMCALGLFALYALFRILIPALPNWG